MELLSNYRRPFVMVEHKEKGKRIRICKTENLPFPRVDSPPCFPLQDRDMTHRQSPCGDSVVGVGDGGKEVEGCVDQLMGLGEYETVCSSSAFEQWDSYWEDLTRYWIIYSCAAAYSS